jgi:hypothetical protein
MKFHVRLFDAVHTVRSALLKQKLVFGPSLETCECSELCHIILYFFTVIRPIHNIHHPHLSTCYICYSSSISSVGLNVCTASLTLDCTSAACILVVIIEGI